MAPPDTSSDIVLERLSKLHPKLIDLSLDRVCRLLDALGNPERRLPPVMHVAGTNGKGSVIAYLRAMLEAAGRRVHVYTSPHLVRFHERIRLAGKLIEETHLLALLEECERANGAAPITFFEVTTCAAFLAFARTPADILLLEVGLGGEYDATNVIDRPLVTVLTPISFDHMQHLGNTLTAIAGVKAGIMKPGAPAVVGPQLPEPLAVFERRAAELGCPLSRHGHEWHARREDERMIFRDSAGERRFPLPALVGTHQIDNAATAIACLPSLAACGVDDVAIARGLRDVEWPARLQRLTHGALAALLPAGWELWLDGCHNADGGRVAAAWAAEQPPLPMRLIFASLSTHDPRGILQPFAGLVRDVHTVAVPGEHKTLSADEAAAAAQDIGLAAKASAGVREALADIVSRADAPGRVLICGSLYLAGTVLAENG
ncbi:MAG: folylpolyglutamate synthase/dihydrofolate synthase family protein [Dongiaceae bacterium]